MAMVIIGMALLLVYFLLVWCVVLVVKSSEPSVHEQDTQEGGEESMSEQPTRRYVAAFIGLVLMIAGVVVGAGVLDSPLDPGYGTWFDYRTYMYETYELPKAWYQEPTNLHAMGFGSAALGGAIFVLAALEISKKR